MPASASASAASYGRPRRVHSSAASAHAPARQSPYGSSPAGTASVVEPGEATPESEPVDGRDVVSRDGLRETFGRCRVDLVESPLEPRDLGVRSRPVVVRLDLIGRDIEPQRLVERDASVRIASSCAHERQHEERLGMRPGRVSGVIENARCCICGLGPATILERGHGDVRENVDTPEIEVARLAVRERLAHVLAAERAAAERAAQLSQPVERARDRLRAATRRVALVDDAVQPSLAAVEVH